MHVAHQRETEMNENEKLLRKVFHVGLALPPDVAVEHLIYNEIVEWDSIGHMQLVAEIEDAFDLMLDTDDIIDMSSYQKTRQILMKYHVDFGD